MNADIVFVISKTVSVNLSMRLYIAMFNPAWNTWQQFF